MLRIAIIGCGRLGGFHGQKLAKMQGVTIAGVVDPIAAAREKLAAELNVPGLASHEPLVEKIDAAVIATPTVLHHPPLIRAGRVGFSVTGS